MVARTLQRWSMVLPLAIGVAVLGLSHRGPTSAEAPRKVASPLPAKIAGAPLTASSAGAIAAPPPAAVPLENSDGAAERPQAAAAPAQFSRPEVSVPAPSAPPSWAADPPPQVAAQFESGRKAFLGKIAEDLSLSEAQQALVQLAYREREEEVARLRVEGRKGTIDRDAYYRLVEAANHRFYDRLETGLSRDQILLLQRFRRQSDAAVNSLRKVPLK